MYSIELELVRAVINMDTGKLYKLIREAIDSEKESEART